MAIELIFKLVTGIRSRIFIGGTRAPRDSYQHLLSLLRADDDIFTSTPTSATWEVDLKKANHYCILSLPESYTTPLATQRFGVLLISRSCFGPLRPFYHGPEYNPGAWNCRT